LSIGDYARWYLLSIGGPIESLRATFKGPLGEVAMVLALAFVVAAAFAWLRIPTIPAYLIVGFLAGPEVFGLFERSETVRLLGEIGVLVMLFVVGVRLDLRILQRVGAAAVAGALAQILIVGGIGALLAFLLGQAPVAAVYIGVVVALSSTVLVVKILGDKKELDSLHGRLALAYLLVQDLVAGVALFVLPTLTPERSEGEGAPLAFAGTLGRMGAFILLATLAYFVFDGLSQFAARSREISLIFMVTWMLAGASVAAVLGLGKEAGAFIAGVVITTASQGHLDANRLGILRDFMVPFYFVTLGSGVSLGGMQRSDFVLAAVCLLLALGAKPLVLFSVLTGARYRTRTAFLTAATSGQLSEFSILLLSAGIAAGQLSPTTGSAVLMAAWVAFVISVFVIESSPRVFHMLEPALRRFERTAGAIQKEAGVVEAPIPPSEVIVFGVGRIGKVIVDSLRYSEISYVAFDFDPVLVARLRRRDPRIFLADAEDPDFLAEIPVDEARLVCATFRNLEGSRALVRALRQRGYKGRVVVSADDDTEAEVLKSSGADIVLVPYVDAAERALQEIERVLAVRLDKSGAIARLELP
jgi:Kef-type K+ transport system membrane component KefB